MHNDISEEAAASRRPSHLAPPLLPCRYNEVIVNSQHELATLPDAIDAFFIVKGTSGVTNLGYGYVVDTRKAHQAFLEEYGKSDRDVPLLIFDPFDWNRPFSPG